MTSPSDKKRRSKDTSDIEKLERATGFFEKLSIKKILIAAALIILVEALLLGLPYIGKLFEKPVAYIDREGGHQYLSEERFNKLMSPFLGKGFLSVDLAQVKSAVEKAAWVETVSIRRLWPSTLTVVVKERMPVAYWNNNGLLDESGQPFFPKGKRLVKDLPRLFGVNKNASDLLTHYKSFQQYFNQKGVVLNAAMHNSSNEWQLGTEDGILIFLGTDPGNDQISRVAELINSLPKNDRERMEYVDARYTNGVAVKWLENAANEKVDSTG